MVKVVRIDSYSLVITYDDYSFGLPRELIGCFSFFGNYPQQLMIAKSGNYYIFGSHLFRNLVLCSHVKA